MIATLAFAFACFVVWGIMADLTEPAWMSRYRQQAAPVEPPITPIRFLTMFAVGVLMWMGIIAGVVAMWSGS